MCKAFAVVAKFILLDMVLTKWLVFKIFIGNVSHLLFAFLMADFHIIATVAASARGVEGGGLPE